MKIKLFEEYSDKLYHEVDEDVWDDIMLDDLETDELSGVRLLFHIQDLRILLLRSLV